MNDQLIVSLNTASTAVSYSQQHNSVCKCCTKHHVPDQMNEDLNLNKGQAVVDVIDHLIKLQIIKYNN